MAGKKPKGQRAEPTADPPKKLPAWRLLNRVQLAEFIGCHPETVTAYVRQGMPVHAQGRRGQESKYDGPACLEWWRQNQGAMSAKEIAQTRNQEAMAKINELKFEIQKRELLRRDQVVFEGQAYTKAWASQVRSLPRRARQAGIVTTAEDEGALADLCRQILSDISSWTTPADATSAAAAGDGAAA